MAANRNQISVSKGLSQSWRAQWVVVSGGAATIAQGTPTKQTTADAAAWTGGIVPMVDTDGTVTAMRFTGVSATTSNDTSAADGVVDTFFPVAGLQYRAAALTAATVDTQTEVNALMGKKVVFDLTSNVWTVDIAAADALVNCVVIVGGNVPNNEVLFVYSQKGTVGDSSTAI